MPQPVVTAVLLIMSLWMPVLQAAQVSAVIQYRTFITCLFHSAQCLEGSSRTQQVPEPTSWSRLKIFHSPLLHVAHAFIHKQWSRVVPPSGYGMLLPMIIGVQTPDSAGYGQRINYKITRQFHVWFWPSSPHCFPLRALFFTRETAVFFSPHS